MPASLRPALPARFPEPFLVPLLVPLLVLLLLPLLVPFLAPLLMPLLVPLLVPRRSPHSPQCRQVLDLFQSSLCIDIIDIMCDQPFFSLFLDASS